MYIYKLALDCVMNYLFFVVEILPFLRQYKCQLWYKPNVILTDQQFSHLPALSGERKKEIDM